MGCKVATCAVTHDKLDESSKLYRKEEHHFEQQSFFSPKGPNGVWMLSMVDYHIFCKLSGQIIPPTRCLFSSAN